WRSDMKILQVDDAQFAGETRGPGDRRASGNSQAGRSQVVLHFNASRGHDPLYQRPWSLPATRFRSDTRIRLTPTTWDIIRLTYHRRLRSDNVSTFQSRCGEHGARSGGGSPERARLCGPAHGRVGYRSDPRGELRAATARH